MNQGRVEQAGTPQEVFDHPANPFVMDFLGNVNVFPGRVQNGRATLGTLDVDYPEYPHAEPRDARSMSVRTNSTSSDSQRRAGDGRHGRADQRGRFGRQGCADRRGFERGLNVELSKQAATNWAKTGDRVFVSPRKTRVFVPEYVI